MKNLITILTLLLATGWAGWTYSTSRNVHSIQAEGNATILHHIRGKSSILQGESHSIAPVVEYGGAAATNAISNNNSSYSQIGNTVLLQLEFNHQRDAGDTGSLTIQLPSSMPTPRVRSANSFFIERADINSVGANKLSMTGSLGVNLELSVFLGGDQTATALASGNMTTTNGAFQGTFIYFTDER